MPVDAKAGDVVFFHCDMLHSGSANRAYYAWRYMVTSFVVRGGLRGWRPAAPRGKAVARYRRGGTAAVAPRALTRDLENQRETQLSLSL